MFNAKQLLLDGLDTIMNNGVQTEINIYSSVVSGTDYDDVLTYTNTGSITTSGVVFPIKARQGSEEAVLMEQGLITTTDKVLYTGSIDISGTPTITVGSNFYSTIENGVYDYTINDETIFKKIFIRNLPNGSLY